MPPKGISALGVALSLGLEITQHYLPNRVPSNLDLGCNGAGALLGAVAGALWGRHVFSDRHHAIWQGHVMTKAYGADFGVLLMAAWLMTQLSPEILLFGTGDLRQMLDLPPVQPFAPERFAHVEATIAQMQALTALGLRFSVDDFGTGYSSLSYLKRLPLYELKIDKTFVDGTPDEHQDAEIVQLVISLAKMLSLRVVAEGVETPQQAEFLRGRGCDLMQGYLFARPMPTTDWLVWVARHGCAEPAEPVQTPQP